MAHEWNIRPRGGVCAVCGKPFEAGEECVSALFNVPETGFERRDYCAGCWEGRADGGTPFSQWQGAYAPPRGEQAKHEPIAHETAEDLLRRLIDIGDPANTNVIYILAVMLERKKQLIERRAVPAEGGIIRFYEQKGTGDTFQILDPQISLDSIADVQKQIVDMLGPKPAPASAAPEAAPAPESASAASEGASAAPENMPAETGATPVALPETGQ